MKPLRSVLVILFVLIATPFLASAAAPDPAAYNGFDVSAATVPLAAIQRGGPPKDGIPAIDQPKFVTAAQAQLQPDDRVLGLRRNGIARAYPVRILNWHEVVNDRVGPESIVIAGYEKLERLMFNVEHRDDRFALKEWVLGLELDGVQKAYPFSILERAAGVSGSINDTVGERVVRIQFDRSHRTARAVDDKGQPLPGVMAFWFAWVAFYPDTAVFRGP